MNKLLLAIACLLLLSSVTVHASPVQLPQSGQTTVYSATDDGDIRAGKPWPGPRFSVQDNHTVIDNLTGLIWAKDANPIKNRHSGFDTDGVLGDGAVSWLNALEYLHRLNTEKYLGHNDWRLPNLNELASLVNQGETSASTWLNTQGFDGAQPLPYWSSSTNVMNTGTAWTVTMDGGPLNYQSKAGFAYVWPVRGGESGGAASAGIHLPRTGQVDCFDSNGASISCAGTGQDGELQMGAAWPQPRFVDNGNQTVTDSLTGLVWTRDANLTASRAPSFALDDNGAVTWQNALDYVRMLNQDSFLGFSDWRLPNRNELASVMNYVEPNPFAWLNWQGIFNVRNNYWTSATVASFTGNAWNVQTTGVIVGENKSGAPGGSFVWPVRGGITPSAATGGSETGALQALNAKSLVKTVAAAATLKVTTSSLASGTVGTAYSQTLSATGGTTPYTWSKKSGSLPTGLTLGRGGVISGTPTSSGTSAFTVQVKDKSSKTATKALTITINPIPPTITTTSLPDGYLNTYFNQTLSATSGKSPYTWSCASGSLPPGLSLSSSGVISGIPNTVGTSSFTALVKDANNSTTTKLLSMTVIPALRITTSNLPAGCVGTPYGQTITASGGKLPYSWSVTSGNLPAGLVLDPSTGMISGTPTLDVSSSFTVQVKDANNACFSATYNFTIYLPPSITTSSLHDSFVGIAFSHTLTAVNGRPPYTWSINGGGLPPGLSLDSASGTISGTPTASGASTFTVQVRDVNNFAISKAYSINITGFGSIAGTITEQSTGAPFPGVVVTLGLTDIKIKNTGDVLFSCYNTPIAVSGYDKIAANDDVKLGCDGHMNTYYSA